MLAPTGPDPANARALAATLEGFLRAGVSAEGSQNESEQADLTLSHPVLDFKGELNIFIVFVQCCLFMNQYNVYSHLQNCPK
ncbi:hypothetical protein XENTR_v10007724 [Xenopus tropicalis]|nr:hypothetical protein XENTR_v10007724 [Xenopus tropicalis]